MNDDSLLTKQLDEYRLVEVLGQGGMARVYRGFDIYLRRWAAIKVIDAPFRTDSDYIVRFQREARAIAQLRHPHIVRLYRYGEVDGLLYIAMEYCEGADLGAVLAAYRQERTGIPYGEISRLTRQVCSALDYAHGKNIIHRDIKPSNIMLDKNGDAIITDFGLALLDEQTQGEIFGTPFYISPEQAISSANAVPQSDLYAVGVILYEIFTGRLPFAASHPYDVALMHLSEPPPPPRQLSPGIGVALEAVLLKALAKEPESRYPSGAALADALDQALHGRAGESRVLTPTPELRHSIARLSNRQPEPTSQAGQRAILDPVSPASDISGAPDTPVDAPSSPTAAAEEEITVNQVKKGKVMTPRYLLRNIRALLIELTEEVDSTELYRIYVDIPSFKRVQRQLDQSRSKSEMIDQLIEYANHTLQMPELLNLAKQRNPAAYEKHKPYYELLSAGRKDLVGSSVGKYHVVEQLGKGGMADVYKAYQSGLARYVAIKVIHSHLADNEEFIERFEREAMAVGSLRHPNIVQVFDFDREDDRYYMVMEFIGGPTLAAEIRERRGKGTAFSLNEILGLFAALTSAIDYAHSRGMIHRDLKPSNIMFMPDRRVVLTDFGLARIVDLPSFTMTNAVMGTPAYMSPEQAQGVEVDARSDIYSLGVILYELVTGRRPFEGEKPVTIIMKLVSEKPVPPTTLVPGLLPGVEAVILTAMSKNPADRYSSAGIMYRALRQALRSIAREDDDTLASASREMGSDILPQVIDQKNKGKQPEAERGLQKADIPEIAGGRVPTEGLPGDTPQKGGQVINISGSSGPVAIGGQHVVQIGSVSGGQVSIGAGSDLPAQPPGPGSEPDLLLLRQLLAQLKARIESGVSADKRLAALERVSELEETLSGRAPDLDTVGYVNNWFARHVPALAEAIAELISHPVVDRLLTSHDSVLAAEYRRRFGYRPAQPSVKALPDPGTTLIGRRMGQYFIVEQVGKGSLARVYRGYHLHTREDAAIKVFFNYLADDQQFLAQFQQEAKAMIALRHPNIVPVLDFETGAEDYCFVVMAYIIGGTLKAHLARLKRARAGRSQTGSGLMPIHEVIRIGQEIAAALDYAHTRGMIHHNLSPANIMFTTDKQTVVTDFGLARLMGGMHQTMMGSSWRSPAYMAPEHAYGEHSDTKSDIYSLGAILFELLTGSPLYKANAPMEQVMKHVSEPAPAPCGLNPDLPAAVDPVFEKVLAKDPQARYPTAGELLQALTLALQG